MKNRMEAFICGQQRELVSSYQAIADIEDSLGCGYLELILERIPNNRLGVVDMARIVTAGLRANKDTRLNVNDVGDDIIAQGVGAYTTIVGQYLRTFHSGGQGENGGEKEAGK